MHDWRKPVPHEQSIRPDSSGAAVSIGERMNPDPLGMRPPAKIGHGREPVSIQFLAGWVPLVQRRDRGPQRLLESRERAAAFRRDAPSLEEARVWHRDMMAGLGVPHPSRVGRFRGEAGLETFRVRVGVHKGVAPDAVGGALARFEQTLQSAVAALDERYPSGQELDADGLAAVIDLSAWAHAEWIRIHPFANGNGRTARIWVNFLLMRYGLPPAMRLRPRPDHDYSEAGAAAMTGDWSPTAAVIRRMLAVAAYVLPN